ncbi:sugar transferase [Candidatus Thioglobus sp.]|jgi:lipopolysaccharide/colanic/teichoic acid biosynthesis glycosyltransferase|nr:sugar transferase [Candidatus Thioglobus sp.]
MKKRDQIIKNTFDFFLSFTGLIALSPIIFLTWLVSAIETNSNGFYFQSRVGKNGKLFFLVKIKTMREVKGISTSITKMSDVRITKSGSFFRKTKLDELPQLWNVLIGQMSFVGPRPDILGYADQLTGEEKIIISIRPGITGPASIKYKSEELTLSKYNDFEKYNDEIIWPDKVKINCDYVKNWSFWSDMYYIYLTIVGKNE